MDQPKRRRERRLLPVGVVFEGPEAHLCALTERDGARYVSVPRNRPDRWVAALRHIARQVAAGGGALGNGSLAAAGEGGGGRPARTRSIGRPLWLALEPPTGNSERLLRVLSAVIPQGSRLSFVAPTRLATYLRWEGIDGIDRFGRAETLARFVVERRPRSETRLLRRLGAA